MDNKSRPLILLTIIAIIIITPMICLSSTSNNIYSSQEFKLSFMIPSPLKLYTAKNPGPLSRLFSAGSIFVLVNPNFLDENINVKVSEGVSENDLVEFKSMLENKPLPVPGYKKISIRFITIGKEGDKKALEHVYNMKGNVLGRMRQVTFIHRGRGFTFTCGTAQNRFNETNHLIFDKIFNNIEFK
jgi:hypothetical protein